MHFFSTSMDRWTENKEKNVLISAASANSAMFLINNKIVLCRLLSPAISIQNSTANKNFKKKSIKSTKLLDFLTNVKLFINFAENTNSHGQ